MSKALTIKEFMDRIQKLETEIDNFKYKHEWKRMVGQDLSSTVNQLTKAREFIFGAAKEQAFIDLEEGTGRGDIRERLGGE